MTASESTRIEDHLKFWKREKPSRPLASFFIGDFFFATHYKAARHLLVKGKNITPNLLDVDAFLEDYERHFAAISKLDQTGFWTAAPYTGIPWREAFWGCEVIAGESSFITHPRVKDVSELDNLNFSMENPWVRKYFEFIEKLNKLSRGRFPVGQPIMRGQGDLLGALLGQTEFIFAMYEYPETVKRFLDKAAESFLFVNEEMHKINPPFHGGSSMGVYHVWAPGKSLWFQEDICALLSPDLYKEFLLESEKRICAPYNYTLVHLHPSSFYNLDAMLSNEKLKIVEINKDVGGPGVQEMLPHYRKVLDAGRNLVIWGDLDETEIKLVYDELPPEGLFLNIYAPTLAAAETLSGYLRQIRF